MVNKGVFAFAAISIGVLLVTPGLLGSKVEDTLHQQWELSQTTMPELHETLLSGMSLDRGWFSTDVTLTISLPHHLRRGDPTLSDDSTLNLNYNVEHGPFFLTDGFKLARSRSEMSLEAILGENTAVTLLTPTFAEMTTVISFSGDIHVSAEIPAFSLASSKNDSAFDFLGAELTMEYAVADRSYDSSFAIHGVNSSLNNSSEQDATVIDMKPLTFSATGQLLPNTIISIGETHLDFSGLMLTSKGGSTISLDALTVNNNTIVGESGLLEQSVRLELQKLSTGTETAPFIIEKTAVSGKATNIDPALINAYTRLDWRIRLMALTGASPAEVKDAEMEQLTLLAKLSEYSPTLSVDDSTVITNFGTLQSSSQFTLQPYRGAGTYGQMMVALLNALTGQGMLTADDSLAINLLAWSMTGTHPQTMPEDMREQVFAGAQQVLDNYVSQQVLKAENSHYVLNHTLQDGKLYLGTNPTPFMDFSSLAGTLAAEQPGDTQSEQDSR
ncbi:hypothetical protein GCM10017044_14560 [Kordiimonas sediminis]|uniref:DUF945 domain-containing protein n=1 Tax=Kordiimonas sediminis TaxID=1735581 RepID=A0A919E7E4_9PROT|nr:DUF945 family protein [Kordiimonas sediminis]GHF20737.1 hypothetical protein GCM10017044_14560 [Kordiimonas sediminis]